MGTDSEFVIQVVITKPKVCYTITEGKVVIMTKEQKFQEIWEQAQNAGIASAEKCVPVPMVVGTPTTPLGSDIDYSKQTYFVAGGVCGFAQVRFAGNTAFGRWAKKNGLAKPDSYYGGLYVWIRQYGQSLQLKEAYAGGFAQVLRDNGIKAYVDSRLD